MGRNKIKIKFNSTDVETAVFGYSSESVRMKTKYRIYENKRGAEVKIKVTLEKSGNENSTKYFFQQIDPYKIIL